MQPYRLLIIILVLTLMSGLKATAQEEDYCLPIPVVKELIKDSENSDILQQLTEQQYGILLDKNRTIARLDSVNLACQNTLAQRTDQVNVLQAKLFEAGTVIESKNNNLKILYIIGAVLLGAVVLK